MDYNIYIHSLGGGEDYNPTKPWKEGSQQTSAWTAEQQEADYNNSSLPVLGVIKKVAPWVAAAIVATKAVSSIYGNLALPIITAETGDYRASVNYANFQNAFNWVLNPIGGGLNLLRATQANRIENAKRSERAILLGDSDFRGEGV